MGRRSKNKFKESDFGEVGGFFSSIFGFIWDGIKLVFKLKPDDDQTLSDFVFEKLGALALLFVCAAILVSVALAIYFQMLD